MILIVNYQARKNYSSDSQKLEAEKRFSNFFYNTKHRDKKYDKKIKLEIRIKNTDADIFNKI